MYPEAPFKDEQKCPNLIYICALYAVSQSFCIAC